MKSQETAGARARTALAVFLVSTATLTVELVLTRVFDVILTDNASYMIVTSAIFAFGLAGVYASLRPSGPGECPPGQLSLLAALFGLCLVLLRPLMNAIPFDLFALFDHPLRQGAWFLLAYLALVVPFFFPGLLFVRVFSSWPSHIHSLYFWDLAGAAAGSVLLIPVLPSVGPGGLLLFAAAVAFAAAALLSPTAARRGAALAAAILCALAPLLRSEGYYDFREHSDKRGVRSAAEKGTIELTVWDPVSKIDIIGEGGDRKHIAYDGGTQSSNIYPFDGDYARLRSGGVRELWMHFWQRGVLASHYLKRDSGARVLVIGSAGGQETKAALMYGAAEVDAVEMVGAVVRLGKEDYAGLNGGVFNDPRVRTHVAEGRSFLRAGGGRYDIIQIFSNHTSSSIASGTGAMATTYLQTVDAYREYFEHLGKDGILHINHHVFPKMIATAARAWKEAGRGDFRRHVVVFGRRVRQDNLPTFMVKMSPWTDGELEELREFFLTDSQVRDHFDYHFLEDPAHPEDAFLPEVFYVGDLPGEVVRKAPYRIGPTTDDRPYFNFLRRKAKPLVESEDHFLDRATAKLLNSQLRRGGVPMDVIHLFVVGAVALAYSLLFTLVPMAFSRAGRGRWKGKRAMLLYFSCLGAGFIVFEVVLIQVFIKLVGSPLHTCSTVIFTMLLAAGLGSLSLPRVTGGAGGGRRIPFAGVIVYGALLILLYPRVFDLLIGAPTVVRVLAAGGLIFPLGFFLGMPFPLGILALRDRPAGTIAWAWAMNGFFTVAGGFGAMVLSIFLGFRATLLTAVALYLLAAVAYGRMAGGAPSRRPAAIDEVPPKPYP